MPFAEQAVLWPQGASALFFAAFPHTGATTLLIATAEALAKSFTWRRRLSANCCCWWRPLPANSHPRSSTRGGLAIHHRYLRPSALEQRETGRAEKPAQTQRYLSHLFDLSIDSKRRACDITELCVRGIAHGEHASSRATVMQQKAQRAVQFESQSKRSALLAWIH